MAEQVRVRFAPSPTGMLHVGGARTALYNWLVAQQVAGAFVLRIEDTDASRNRPEWTEGIIRALDWIGIHPGSYEGPYFQSERAERHKTATQQLYAAGKAYYCACTREEVQARTGNSPRGYDGFCRERGLEPAEGRALRFRTPDEGMTTVVDLIRGKPSFENVLMEDFAIARGDGSAVFLLANVVDDMDMGITHVIRAEEHLSNTPKAQLLWEALGGGEFPVWAHVPVIVNEKRQKLSKRRDKVALEAYRDEGYLAAAMKNYLMLLGWAPSGDREIAPWEIIESEFRLEQVHPSPAFFDEKKLRAFNGDYIRALSVPEFIVACQPWLTAPVVPWAPEQFDAEVFATIAPLAQTRVTVLSEIPALVDFLFLETPPQDDAAWQKAMKEGSNAILSETIAVYQDALWHADELKQRLEVVGQQHGLKLGKAQAPIRVAVTGRTVGLPLFESLQVLGRKRTLDRLQTALTRLSSS